jgi:hypothetical protein
MDDHGDDTEGSGHGGGFIEIQNNMLTSFRVRII